MQSISQGNHAYRVWPCACLRSKLKWKFETDLSPGGWLTVLTGRKDEAAALVPADLLERTSLIGSAAYIADRLAVYREAGVSTLNVMPLAPSHEQRVRLIEQIRDLAS